jgi:plastocyanin
LNAVKVTCAPETVNVGRTTQCTASAVDQNGAPFSVSGYTWTSSDTALASVDGSGKVSAQRTGSVTVRASATAGDVTRQGEATLTLSQRAPTLHSTSLTTSETWRASDNPHVVRGQLTVSNGAALTLEAGAEVRFAPDAELRFTQGSLLAPGTASAPVVLAADGSGGAGSWRGLVFASSGSASRLEHVALSGCGATAGEGACLTLRDQAAPVLVDVAVRDSGSAGVRVLDDGSAFGSGSARLSVTGSQGYAVRIGANQADSLPSSSTYSANTPNAVELTGNVSRSLTWPNPGVPFVVPGLLTVAMLQPAVATLTVSAGTTVRFGPNAQLSVSPETGGPDLLLGALEVKGTADAPVLFTADAASPQPGHWRGLDITHNLKTPSRLAHLTVEYGGAPPADRFQLDANINLYGLGNQCTSACPILTDVTSRKGKGKGFTLNYAIDFGAGSARLSALDNGGFGLQTEPDSVGSVPRSLTLTGNGRDAVELSTFGVVAGGSVRTQKVLRTQTWPKLGVPYVLQQPLEVAAETPPTLTLEPGIQVRVAEKSALVVGYTDRYSGKLLAQGTADAPIEFVPDGIVTAYGWWSGLQFWHSEGSRLDYVLVTNGGGQGDTSLGITGQGNINVFREQGGFVTHTTVRRANRCAFVGTDGSPQFSTKVTTNFLDPQYNNTAVDNGFDLQCTY